jgi:hypothetical protein
MTFQAKGTSCPRRCGTVAGMPHSGADPLASAHASKPEAYGQAIKQQFTILDLVRPCPLHAHSHIYGKIAAKMRRAKIAAIADDLQPIFAAMREQLALTPRTSRSEIVMTVAKNPEQGESRNHAPDLQQESTRLAAQYGEIGISAVAAALPYTGDKAAPQAEAEVRIDQRFIEAAA